MNMCRERERRKFDPTKQYLIHKVLYMYTYTRVCVCVYIYSNYATAVIIILLTSGDNIEKYVVPFFFSYK